MIRAVLFDYGGVLSTGGGSGCIQRFIGAVYGIAPAKMNADEDLLLAARAGAIGEQAFFDQMNRRHPDGPRLNRQNFLAASDVFVVSKAVYALAAQLRGHGLCTAILSNIYDFTAEELRAHGLYDDFDPVVLSCDIHIAKPDPRAYEFAVQEIGVKPEEILFIDDIPRCLAPAKKLGMQTILATSPQQIVADTKALLLQHNNLRLQ